MANLVQRARLTAAFDGLLQDLRSSWPKADIAYVGEEAEHYEFDDSLENLVALALRNGRQFSRSQRRQVDAVVASLGIQDSPLLVQLKASDALALRAG